MASWAVLFLIVGGLASPSSAKRVSVQRAVGAAEQREVARDEFAALTGAGERLFSSRGEPRASWGALVEGETVQHVARGRHFLWPAGSRVDGLELADPGGDGDGESESESAAATVVSLEALASSPRVFRVHDFMSGAEADEMMRVTQSKTMRRSGTGADSAGGGATSSTRTSENAWDVDGKLSLRLQRRAFALLKLPWKADRGGGGPSPDGLQLLRYRQKQAYIVHTDWLGPGPRVRSQLDPSTGFDWDASQDGSDRFATIFLYLSDVEGGGQTVFPEAPPAPGGNAESFPGEQAEATALFSAGSWQHRMVKQCFSSLAVRPKKGSAILFYNQLPTGVVDPNSAHGGCPVIRGTKYAANLWVWSGALFHESTKVQAEFKCELAPPAKCALMYVPDDGGAAVAMGDVAKGTPYKVTTYQGHGWQFSISTEGHKSRAGPAWTISAARDTQTQVLGMTADKSIKLRSLNKAQRKLKELEKDKVAHVQQGRADEL